MKNNAKKTAKKKKRALLNTRRSVVIVALVAVLVLLINLITASYSWFAPNDPDEHSGLQYHVDAYVRSENCSMSTFEGVKLTAQTKGQGEYIDQIRYNANPSSGSVNVSASDANIPTIRYFKTEIINHDSNYASDISLYATQPTGSSSSAKYTLAVTYPGNSVRTFSASSDGDVYIVRNAYVKRHDNADVNGPGKLVIEWFIKAESGTTSINLDNLYLLYN